MKQYNIYAGLNGSFGGATYQYTASYENPIWAEEDAYFKAIEIYESKEGLHGLRTYLEVETEYCEENDIDCSNLTEEDNEAIEDLYHEECDNWIEYYIIPTEEDKNISKEELHIIDD